VGGHSAGAQLAVLICVDDRYLKKEGVPFKVLRGCVPVDGDTYDIPKIIMTAEHRQALYGGKMFTFVIARNSETTPRSTSIFRP